MTSRRSSGSRRDESSVEPTRSQNMTVSCRRSARSAWLGAASGADEAGRGVMRSSSIARSRRLRCPSSTPSFSRSASFSSGNTSVSIALSRKAGSYRSRPSPRSQLPISTALPIPGRYSDRDFGSRLSQVTDQRAGCFRHARTSFPAIRRRCQIIRAGLPAGHSTGQHVAAHNAAGADDAAIANVTPGRMMTPPPIHTPLAIRIGRANSNPESRDVAHRSASSLFRSGASSSPAESGMTVFGRLPQILEQNLCLFEVLCVEAFGEPAVDRPQQVTRFGLAALVATEPSKDHGGAQFPELCSLLLGDAQSFAIHFFGSLGLPSPREQPTFVPIELSGQPALPGSFRDLQTIVQQIHGLLNLPCDLARPGQEGDLVGHPRLRPGGAVGRRPVSKERHPLDHIAIFYL